MPEYRVTWEVDVDADSAEEAARKAREMQLDEESTADVFDVRPYGTEATITVDLGAEREREREKDEAARTCSEHGELDCDKCCSVCGMGEPRFHTQEHYARCRREYVSAFGDPDEGRA